MCFLAITYLRKAGISNESIEMTKIDERTILNKDYGLKIPRFFDDNKRMILSDPRCGIFVYNLEKEKIDHIIRQDNIYREDENYETYANVNMISPDKRLLAIATCQDKDENIIISLYRLSDYVKITEFKTRYQLAMIGVPDHIDLFFSEDSKRIFAVGCSEKRIEVQGWDIKTKSTFMDSTLMIDLPPDLCRPLYFADNHFLVFHYIINQVIRIYDIDNMKLEHEVPIEITARDSFYDNGKLFYLKRNKIIRTNLIAQIKYYDIKTRETKELPLNIYNPGIYKLINNRILLFTERKEYLPFSKDSDISPIIFDQHVRYYDIKKNKILYDFDISPNCVIYEMSDNGKIWFLRCRVKATNKNNNEDLIEPYRIEDEFYLAFPKL